MKIAFLFLMLLYFLPGFTQQYDSVILEEDQIDENNEIYKTGSVFIYDYEIVILGTKNKLKYNREFGKNAEFQFVSGDSVAVDVEKIHLIVQPVEDEERSNENQTQISYLQGPKFDAFASTGAVENGSNVWIHPIREGFFSCLETAPFPFVKKPLIVGAEWTDQMAIGAAWGNELWGQWTGSLLLTYHYKVAEKKDHHHQVGNDGSFCGGEYRKLHNGYHQPGQLFF